MFSAIYNFYIHINYDLQDVRTQHLPLMYRPISIVVMAILYNYIALSLGPRLMANRRPFVLRKAIIVFDFLQIIINIYLFYKAFQLGWLRHFNFFCAGLDMEDNPHNREIAFTCYLYFLVKVSDFVDTMFMVLKKKDKHISFLHLYHHTGMMLMTWFNTKYMPVGHHTCLGIYNTFVHAIMYSYYLTAALYPEKNMISFKKRLTQIQMIQFLLIPLHMSTVLLVPGCEYPGWVLSCLLPNNFMIFILFYDFYRKTYILPTRVQSSTIKQS